MWQSRRNARRTFAPGLLLVFLIAQVPVFGQTQPLSFEVASIKPAEPITPASVAAGKVHVGMSVDAARVDIGYFSLADLIPTAFGVKPYQVSGPDWMRSQRFDIIAKMPEGATKEQVPEMLRVLLEERFRMKFHKETRDANVYALVVAKGGHKMKEAETETPAPDAAAGVAFGTGPNQIRVNPERGGATVTSQAGKTRITPNQDGTLRMEMERMPMLGLAEMLSPFVDRPVVDMTELKGNYQVALDLTMDSVMNVARSAGVAVPQLGARGADPTRPAEASDPSSSSIFNSIQQLGLRLEARKAPAEFIVIDSIEKNPTEN